jgi:uncharacterized heparinase superfamily protein
VYIYQFDSRTLTLRCGPAGQQGNGGHAHNDQLSFELTIGGQSVIVDPGTYLYTPSPAIRNRYRSTAMHNTLVFADREQNDWEAGQRGLFSLHRCSQARVIAWEGDTWIGEHDGFGRPHRRILRLRRNGLDATDVCHEPGARWLAFHLAPNVRVTALEGTEAHLLAGSWRVVLRSVADGAAWSMESYLYSPAYGWAEPAVCLRLHHGGPRIDWQLVIEEDP